MSDPRPTTWRSGPTPVCATDEMIEAGVAGLRVFLPMASDRVARALVRAVLDEALKAIPRPIENDPEAGDRSGG